MDDDPGTISYYGRPCSGTTTEWYVLLEDAESAVKKYVDSLGEDDWFDTSINKEEILEIVDANGKIEYKRTSRLEPVKMVCLEGKYYDYEKLFSSVDFSKSEYNSTSSQYSNLWRKKRVENDSE